MTIVCSAQSTLKEWRFVFWISFVIFMVTTVVYVLWASGKTQLWDNPTEYYAARASARAARQQVPVISDKPPAK